MTLFIRDFPDDLADRLKSYTQKKNVTRAVLKMVDDFFVLRREVSSLRSEVSELRSRLDLVRQSELAKVEAKRLLDRALDSNSFFLSGDL